MEKKVKAKAKKAKKVKKVKKAKKVKVTLNNRVSVPVS
jgi:hypothetical protein